MINNQLTLYSDWNLWVLSLWGDHSIAISEFWRLLQGAFPWNQLIMEKKSHQLHRYIPIVFKFGTCQCWTFRNHGKKKWLLPKLVRHFSGAPSIKQYDEWLKKPPDGIRPPPGSPPVTGSPGRAQHVEHAQWMRGTGGALRGITGRTSSGPGPDESRGARNLAEKQLRIPYANMGYVEICWMASGPKKKECPPNSN